MKENSFFFIKNKTSQKKNRRKYLLGPIGDASGCDGVCCNHGVRPGLNVDGVAPAPKYMPVPPNGPGPNEP